MLKNLSFLALAGAMTFSVSMTGCILVTDDGNDDAADGTTGDGDGDGDGTEVGDGDGDGTGETTGDGDGDGDGDGTGETTGDGDGDTPPAACGWDAAQDPAGYYCDGEGEDPAGAVPYACPEGLVEDGECGEVTNIGCCDADGNNWYCVPDTSTLFKDPCGQ